MNRGSVAIVGVGVVGMRIAQALGSHSACKELILINRGRDRLLGVDESLRSEFTHRGLPTRLRIGETSDARDCEVVVICTREHPVSRGTDARPDWMPPGVRYENLLQEVPAFLQLLGSLRGGRGTLMVVSNPVEVFTQIASTVLPEWSVCGLGCSVDSVRLAASARERTGVPIVPSECPIGGVHGDGMVPLRSLWSHRMRSLTDDANVLQDLLRDCAFAGPRMLQRLRHSATDCAVVFATDVERVLVGDSSIPFVAAVATGDGVAGVPIVSDGRGLRRADAALSEGEQVQIRSRAADISAVVRALSEWCIQIGLEDAVRLTIQS